MGRVEVRVNKTWRVMEEVGSEKAKNKGWNGVGMGGGER